MHSTGVPRDSWFSPKIEVRESTLHGKGTFALAPIEPGEVVEIWGEWSRGVKNVEYTNDLGRIESARVAGKVVMQWDEGLYSIEERGSDDGYFINHSCDGNLWFRDAFTLEARRPIAREEEVTIDYALFEHDFVAAWDCDCGASFCRRHITGQDWRLADLQERYGMHFTPLLNRLILASRST